MSSEHDKFKSDEKKDPFESVIVPCKTAMHFLQELDETHERWGRTIMDLPRS